MAIVIPEDFKEYQRIEHNHEDVLIGQLLDQAQRAAENHCRTEFDDTAEEPVKLAIMLHAGYMYERRSEPEEKSYKAMMRAFGDLLSSYVDPAKEF